MRTLVLAEQAFRDLRSRAILDEIATRFGSAKPLLLADCKGACPPAFEPVPAMPNAASLRVKRVVIAGVFQDRVQLERALYVARQAVAGGATVETHSLTIVGEAALPDMPAAVGVLDTATVLEVREHYTADRLLVWRVAAAVTIRGYAERHVPQDPSVADELPAAPLLGLSILGGNEVQADIAKHGAVLRLLVEAARGWPIVPLPVEAPGSPVDDIVGARHFASEALPQSAWLLPSLADPAFRRTELSPARLKAVVARCALVVTNQDIVAAYAVAAGVPVIGIKLGPDRRIVTCLAALANDLPPGSDLVFPGRYRRPQD